MGIYLEPLLCRIRRLLFQFLIQTWKPGDRALPIRPQAQTMTWVSPEMAILSVIGSDSWGSSSSDGALISLLLSSFTYLYVSLSCSLEPFRTNLSSDFHLNVWKRLSHPVFPRPSLSISLMPTAPVGSSGPEMVGFLDPLSRACPSPGNTLRLVSEEQDSGLPSALRAARSPHRGHGHVPASAARTAFQLQAQVQPPKWAMCAAPGPPSLCLVESLLHSYFSGSEKSAPHNCAQTALPSHMQKNLQIPFLLTLGGKNKDELCASRPLVDSTWLLSFFLLKCRSGVSGPGGHRGVSGRWAGCWGEGTCCSVPFQAQQLSQPCASVSYFRIRFRLNKGFNHFERRKLSMLSGCGSKHPHFSSRFSVISDLKRKLAWFIIILLIKWLYSLIQSQKPTAHH